METVQGVRTGRGHWEYKLDQTLGGNLPMSLTILKADPAVLLWVSPLENYMYVHPRRPIPGSVALVITKLGRTEDWPRALGILCSS